MLNKNKFSILVMSVLFVFSFNSIVYADVINTFSSTNSEETLAFPAAGNDSSVSFDFPAPPYDLISAALGIEKASNAAYPNNNELFYPWIDLGESGDQVFNSYYSLDAYDITAQSEYSRYLAYGDLDGDGDGDFVDSVANYDGCYWYENDGLGNYTPHLLSGSSTIRANALDIVDLDLDGDNDVVAVSNMIGTASYWYRNDGGGSFSRLIWTPASKRMYDIEVGDVDLDGDMDIVTVSDEDENYWYENDGTTSFISHSYDAEGNASAVVKLVDLDLDGDLDIVEGTEGGDDFWHENDGLGGFTRHVLLSDSVFANDLEVVDLNEDGDMDVLLVNAAYGALNRVAYLENDGTENFTLEYLSGVSNGISRTVDVLDYDQDLDLDVVVYFSNGQLGIFINDGAENFELFLTEINYLNSVEYGFVDDFDGDGLPEYAMARAGRVNSYYDMNFSFYDESVDFTSILQDYLDNDCVGFPCSVPFKVFADRSGELTLKSLLINYDPNAPVDGDWEQINYPGFGDEYKEISDLQFYDGDLYIIVEGRHKDNIEDPWEDSGSQVWRYDGPNFNDWTLVNTLGFGDSNNIYGELFVYDGKLFAGVQNSVTGAQIWVYDGAVWNNIVNDGLGSNLSISVSSFALFGSDLIVSLYHTSLGPQIWTYDGSAWTNLINDGFADVDNISVEASLEYNGKFYAAVRNDNTGVEIWEYDGALWSQVNTDGFGDAGITQINGMAVYSGELYVNVGASFNNQKIMAFDGSAWTQKNTDGFGVGYFNPAGLEVFNGRLYASVVGDTFFTSNPTKIFMYDGVSWVQNNTNGFNVLEDQYAGGFASYGSSLVYGFNAEEPFKVWKKEELVLSADLAVTNVLLDDTVNEGENVEFTITVTNNGASDATNIEISDLLPAGLTYVSSLASQGSYDEILGVWDLGDLLNTASATLTIVASVDEFSSGNVITNTASVSAVDQVDLIVANNSADAVVNVYDKVDLSVSKLVDKPLPERGEQINYTIVIENNGPGDADLIELTDVLPAGLTFVSSLASQGSYDELTGLWDVGTILNAANASLSITLTVDADASGTITNIAELTDLLQLDLDSTVNNGVDTEDDYSKVDLNVSVPAPVSSGGGGGAASYFVLEQQSVPELDESADLQPEDFVIADDSDDEDLDPVLVDDGVNPVDVDYAEEQADDEDQNIVEADDEEEQSEGQYVPVYEYEPVYNPSDYVYQQETLLEEDDDEEEEERNLDQYPNLPEDFNDYLLEVDDEIVDEDDDVFEILSNDDFLDRFEEEILENDDISDYQIVLRENFTESELNDMREDALDRSVVFVVLDGQTDFDNDGVSDLLELSMGLSLFEDDEDGDGFSLSEELFLGFDPREADELPKRARVTNIDDLKVGPLPSFRVAAKANDLVEIYVYSEDREEFSKLGNVEIDARNKGEYRVSSPLAEGGYMLFTKDAEGLSSVASFRVEDDLDEVAPEISIYLESDLDQQLLSGPVKGNRLMGDFVVMVLNIWEDTNLRDRVYAVYMEGKSIHNLDSRLVLRGLTYAPGDIVYITYKSLVLSSVVMSDASSGELIVELPEDLESGEHELIVYAFDSFLNEMSSSSKLIFRNFNF